MANKPIKRFGVITNIYQLERRENNGNVYCSQKVSLQFEADNRIKYLNFVIKGEDRIKRLGPAIMNSYQKGTGITVTYDDGAGKASTYPEASCWRVDEYDTTEVDERKVDVTDDGTPFVGMTPTEPAQEAVPVSEAVAQLQAAVGATEQTVDLPF